MIQNEVKILLFIMSNMKQKEKYNIESVTVSTDKGSETITTSKQRSWTQTYGPVSKGFRASITAKGGWATVNIYVCKGNEPFALKKSKSNNVGNSNTSTSASYTIDY